MTPRTRNSDFKLVPVTDPDFDWLLIGGGAERGGLTIAPGGIDDDVAVLGHVRAIVRRMSDQHESGNWMMVAGSEVVGLIGFHRAPSEAGEVEIGYNVAPSRRRRGYATAAVAALIELAAADARIETIVAGTDPANVASQRALERNGFQTTGRSADGDLRWKRTVEGQIEHF
jgi:RimJ/RimL family protein N-acetyltransferase